MWSKMLIYAWNCAIIVKAKSFQVYRTVCCGFIKGAYSNCRGQKHTIKQINATLSSFAHFHTGCSSLLITALNSSVNKTCWQHVTACDIKTVYIKTWFMCGSQGSSIRLLQVHSSALPCLHAAAEAWRLQKGRRPLWMSGSECEAEERNRHALMRPPSLFVVFISRQKGKRVCERKNPKLCELGCVRCKGAMSVCCVWECETSVSVCVGGGGYFNTCFILWQQSDSRFRSVQTMRLTQHCSPQPQCNLHFLKPAPVLYAIPV